MFMLIFTAGIALLSVYFFWRFHAVFASLGRWNLAVLALLALLASSRYLARASGRLGWLNLSEAIKLVGAVWLVLLLWFLVVGLALNLWNLLAASSALVRPGLGRLRIGPGSSFAVTAVLVAAAGTWAWFEAARIRVNHVVIEVAHLPPGVQSLRLAQVTDLHVGAARSRGRLADTVRMLQDLRPDLVVSTGDLIDADFERIGSLAGQFRQVQPPLGKFAVLGNHEFYAGLDDSLAFHEAAGFRLLRQESAEPIEGLRLVGVDDPAARRRGRGERVDEMPVLPGGPRQALVILLKHQPRINDAAVGRFDVQLSGHTHGGQVYPFSVVPRLVYGYWPGLHELSDGSKLWLSRGTGTWGPPLRLGNPPEITLIEFRRSPAR